MPTLEFKGKQYIYSHHHSVPFRELLVDSEKSLPANGNKPSLDDNLIIHGDNLHALKALMPHYAGKIKCIYIDPPYNTGNEGWCYNDNVNSPLMKEWLEKNANPVDKEDMQRHDKWLCMMFPRLKLLHELLADDGVIFVSIDDNEMHRLRMLMDDIFGSDNFLGQVSVLVNPKGRGLKNSDFAKTHEYLISYQGSKRKENIGKTKDDEKVENEYKEFDAEGKRFRALELRNTHSEYGKHNRENLWYPFYVNDDLNISLDPQKGFEPVFPVWDDGFEGCWTWDKAKAKRDSHLIVAKLVKNKKKIYRMSYPDTEDGERVKQKIKTMWNDPLFFTEQGRKDIEQVIPDCSFSTPKPIELIKEIISFFPAENLIILDSFAGSGTTAQAVLSLNYIDGENRKFILVEAGDYADSITAERIKRIIKGIPAAVDTGLKAGLGGSFTFCELGKEISIEKIITGESLPDYGALARYVFYTATGKSLDGETQEKLDYFVGETDLYEVYLIYKPDIAFLRSNDSALNDVKLKAIAARNSKKEKLVFATAKYMGQKELSDQNISFCQLPYAIHKVVGA